VAKTAMFVEQFVPPGADILFPYLNCSPDPFVTDRYSGHACGVAFAEMGQRGRCGQGDHRTEWYSTARRPEHTLGGEGKVENVRRSGGR
jgi:hypothetical protein